MFKLFKILIVIAVAVLASVCVFAQNSDPLFSQYYQLPTLYNAGATGSTDYLRIRGGARLQWVGIDNAPKSFTGTADMPVKIGNKRIGVGVALMQEGIGLFSNLDLGVQASYKLKLFKGELSIGVQGAYINSKFKGSEVELPDGDDYHDTDEAIPTQDLSGNGFDFSAGLWYTHPKFYMGISGRHLLAPTLTMSVEGTESNETKEYDVKFDRTLYFTAGSNIPLKNTLFELQPSLIVMTDLTDFTGQVDLRARYNRLFSFGLGYRYKSGINVSLGAEYKNFYLGYSYEYPLSAIAKASSGSHEIVAGYSLKLNFNQQNKNKHRSIRFM
ncbi:MAG: type IX secretion system membrane protein PorP/SprF [Prevotella sp.]|nr:type IX secretion system membrane protein PorP/SprF [Prevotella sp.]MCM1074993.1 type IX secretion system membrane protein PorP/SprF [Ruminococcus sp.]